LDSAYAALSTTRWRTPSSTPRTAATGSAFKPVAVIERDKLLITKGEDNFLVFGDENGYDVRCKLCGSYLIRSFATAPSSTSPWVF
jgi:hypothetical protein